MANAKDEYSFLNNIDNKVLVAMVILASGLTIFAIALNMMTRTECTVSKYIYCEPEAAHDNHAAHAEH